MLVGCSRAKHDDVFPRPRGIHIGQSVYVKGPPTREPNGPNRALLSLRSRLCTRIYMYIYIERLYRRLHAHTRGDGPVVDYLKSTSVFVYFITRSLEAVRGTVAGSVSSRGDKGWVRWCSPLPLLEGHKQRPLNCFLSVKHFFLSSLFSVFLFFFSLSPLPSSFRSRRLERFTGVCTLLRAFSAARANSIMGPWARNKKIYGK